MSLSQTQEDIIKELKTCPAKGLSRDEASKRRESDQTFNVVDPPLKCPGWVCCLLPCIKSLPSMKKFREIQPEDAEILRDSKWIRYDAASLVRGDIIKILEGDIIPADCVLLSLDEDEMLVDLRNATGEDNPKSIMSVDGTCPAVKLYYGGRLLQGSATAVVVAIGPNTLVASLIRRKLFPPKENVLGDVSEDEEVGISLISHESVPV